MADIRIVTTEETPEGYRFDVTVGTAGHTTNHSVSMRHADYERWDTEAGMAPAAVARRSIEQLLRRAGHERLPAEFDVRQAMQLYPAFEAEAHRALE